MDIPLIIFRTLHFTGAILVAGVFGFAVMIAGASFPVLRRRLMGLAWIAVALLLLSAPLLLLAVGQGMTGDTLIASLQQGIEVTVLTDTQFGRVLALRIVLALLLLPCIRSLGRWRGLDAAALLLAATQLAAIAWQGHAGADIGWEATLHLAADAAHLVAAGLWLGALVPLVLLLRTPLEARVKHQATIRFSALGLGCVVVLLLSGVANGVLLVGSWPALVGTVYGQVLLAKLALVAIMLLLAAINRWYLTPRLLTDERRASTRIARHTITETVLGLGVIAVVAALGTMVPGAHQAISWPFASRPVIVWWPPQLHFVAATPASYAVSPEPFAVANIATGAALYVQNCASCHGDEGQGDGSMSADLPVVPLDFAALQVASKPDGDLYWAITSGMPNAMMPSFTALSEAQRWDLVAYLKALRQARAATSTLLAEPTSSPAPLAPDFTLPVPQNGADTLAALLASGEDVLLVLDSSSSLPGRFDQLAQWREVLVQNGVTEITISDSADIRNIYALYERLPQLDQAPPAPHIEFLIDRAGYIRARWRPGNTPDWTQLPVLQDEINAMRRMKLAPGAPTGHVHEG